MRRIPFPPFRVLPLFCLLCLPPFPRVSAGEPFTESTPTIQSGPASDIVLVDGTRFAAQVLFRHPNAPVVVLRAPGNHTLQSLPVDWFHSVDGRIANPRRPFTEEEKTELATNLPWGHVAGERQLGRYAEESWTAKPAIIWARPGKSGGYQDPANWLDHTGEPLTESPWKKIRDFGGDRFGIANQRAPNAGYFDGDILLPRADKPYKVLQSGNRDHLDVQRMRHLTVERNADYRVRYHIVGNLWLKDGSTLGGGTQTGNFGSGWVDKHTFARFCGERLPERRRPKESRHHPISHWVRIDTGEKGSLEIIGETGGASDRTSLDRGTVVVSGEGHLGNGNRASFFSSEDSTLILLRNAQIGCYNLVQRPHLSTAGISGTLMFGSPDKPLTDHSRFYLARMEVEAMEEASMPSQRTQGAGLVLGPNGNLRIHSADPARAKVVFTSFPEDAPHSPYAVGKHRPDRDMPKGITMILHGDADLTGAAFNYVQPGGIAVDPAQRTRWRHLSFGPENLAEPENLFTDLKEK